MSTENSIADSQIMPAVRGNALDAGLNLALSSNLFVTLRLIIFNAHDECIVSLVGLGRGVSRPLERLREKAKVASVDDFSVVDFGKCCVFLIV